MSLEVHSYFGAAVLPWPQPETPALLKAYSIPHQTLKNYPTATPPEDYSDNPNLCLLIITAAMRPPKYLTGDKQGIKDFLGKFDVSESSHR